MRSLSNLVKSAFVTEKDTDSRVIDSNEMIAEKLRVLTEQMEAQLLPDEEEYGDGFMEGLNADQVEELMADRDSAPESNLQSKVEEAKAELERLNAQAEEVIADAKTQADSIIANAKQEASQIMEDARNAGHEEGYQNGYQEGLSKVREAEDALAVKKKN